MQSSAAASQSACSAADAAAPGVPGLTAQAAAVLQTKHQGRALSLSCQGPPV